MSAYDKAHLTHDWNTTSIDIPKKVYSTRYPQRSEYEHIQTNNPDLSNEDIYLNMTIHNYETDKTIPCTYSENRKKPMLWNGSDYKMSVVRFDCPSQEIPMFFWPGDTTFQIGIRTKDNVGVVQSHEVYINYPAIEEPVPAGSNKAVWYVDQMLKAINDAIDVICTNGTFAAGNPLFDTVGNRPRLIYTPESQIFTWLYKQNINGANPGPWQDLAWTPDLTDLDSNSSAYVWVNQKLDFLFYNFPKLEVKNDSTVQEVKYKVYNKYNNSLTSGGVDYYVMEQQHSSINLWYELYKIVITSNMEIRKEFIGISSNDPNNNTTYRPDSLIARGILTDFDIQFPRATSLRINYNPSAEFRWIDILKDGPLDLLDFGIYYQSQDGQLRNLLLEPGQAANIKILFRKK